MKRLLAAAAAVLLMAQAEPGCVQEPGGFLLSNSEWTTIADSDMEQLYDVGIDLSAGRFRNVQAAWSGAVCVNDELWVLGGGHDDSDHNGLFILDPSAGTWRRGWLPSVDQVYTLSDCPGGTCSTPLGDCTYETDPSDAVNCGIGKDGVPVSKHTYNALATGSVSGVPKFCSIIGSVHDSGTSGAPVEAVSWCMDTASIPETPTVADSAWFDFLPSGVNYNNTAGANAILVDELLYAGVVNQMAVYNFSTDTWSPKVGSGPPVQQTMVYAEVTDEFCFFGNNPTLQKCVARSSFGVTGWSSIANLTIPESVPGVSDLVAYLDEQHISAFYYAPEQRVLLWKGGAVSTDPATIVTFDPSTREWGSFTPGGTAPPAWNADNSVSNPANSGGVMGRFNYCDGRVLLVHSTELDVYYLQEATP